MMKKKIRKDKKDQRPNIIKERWSEVALSDKINIVIAIISFCSLVFVGITIYEMRMDREATYKPTLLINPTELEFSWDSDGNEEWVLSAVNYNESQTIDDDGNIIGTLSIPMTILQNNGLERFNSVNVGVGNARDIVFEWGSENAYDLNSFLIECDSSKKDFFQINKSASFSFGNNLVITDVPTETRFMYMLANAEETYSISLPSVYSLLIHEIIKTNNHNNRIPSLLLSASYYDIQGKMNTEVFVIQIKKTLFEEDESGAGRAKYQLIPAIAVS